MSFLPFVCKRRSFAYEKELRVLIWDTHRFHDRMAKREAATGITTSVDLDMLIEAVYIAPSAKAPLFEVVQRLTKQFLGDKPVRQSSLDDPALM